MWNLFYRIRSVKAVKLRLWIIIWLYMMTEKSATFLTNFFVNVVPNLNIPEFTGSDNLHVIGDSVQPILHKYRNHPSIIKIKEKRESSEKFVFIYVSENEIRNLLRKLNAQKLSQKSDIPIKQIKDNLDIFSQVMAWYCKHFRISICYEACWRYSSF